MRGVLARLGFERTELAVDSLARLGALPTRDAALQGSVRGRSSALLASITASANPDLAARVLADLVLACTRAHADGGGEEGAPVWTPDKLLTALHRQPWLRQRVIAMVAASRSLGTWLIAHPEELDGLADDRRFTEPVDPDELRAGACAAVRAAASDNPGSTGDPGGAGDQPAWDALRRFRRREFVRIAVRDVLQTDTTEASGRALAALGDACLEAALWLSLRSAGASPGVRIALLGMGKLGGQELNYVSDLDIIACHEPAPEVSPDQAARIAARVLRQVVAGLSHASREGVGYRVDFNLRPEGRDGPLSRTLDSYTAYWDRWAQPWEFQALLKVRPVAGDRELGERFRQQALARVYPERLDAGAIAEIRRMKARVEASVRARAEAERHVKLGTGGIRDIEWAVQLLQLVHARQDPGLRSPSTLPALRALADAQLVGAGDAGQLADAYRFQRTVEHRLQLLDERRTHTLPDDPAEIAWLARILGYRDRPDTPLPQAGPRGGVERFQADYRRHAHTVRGLHEKLFYRPLLEVFGAVPPLPPEAVRDRLAGLGFAAPDQAVRHLAKLTAGLSRSAALMRVALPVLLPSVAAAPDPDAGLLQLRALTEKLTDRPAFLQILRENPVAAEHLCTILGTSPLLGELLQRQPELVDAFADDRRLLGPPGSGSADDLRAEAVADALAVVRRVPTDDPAAAWDALRRFQRREFLRVAVRDLLYADTTERVGQRLAALAEACLEAGLWLALRESTGRRLPGAHAEGGRSIGDDPPVRVALLGMGKLGGQELNYASDLDLLVVHEPTPGTPAPDAARAAERAVKEVMRGLGSFSREGRAYTLDFRLRPEGRDGPLTRTLDAYRSYWDRWAWTWEFHALIKVRPVAGDPSLGERFRQEALARAYPEDLAAATVAEIHRMKARVETERLPRGADPRLHLKLGPGALTDVEWTAQLKQLELGGRHPEVRVLPTRDALARLRDLGVFGDRDHAWLLAAYDLCARLRDLGFLVTGRPMDLLPTDPAILTRLARALPRDPGDGPESDAPGNGEAVRRQQLMERYRRATRRARTVVEEHFWGGRL